MSTLVSQSTSYPRAILHIDGDSFFAACEQARNPALRGKPVITGKERGIAASMSYEAKLKGVTRAMPLWEIKKICPDAVFLPSDYETYSILSRRFYAIVRRYTPDVEEYGIDECFADITGWDKPCHMTYVAMAIHLQEALKKELGSTFSIGLAPNKVLAKLGSKWKKPYGFTAIPLKDIHRFLNIPVGKIWGIGYRTAPELEQKGFKTALQFALAKQDWVKIAFARPHYDIWKELNGQCVMPLHEEEKTSYGSMQKFKTFTPPSRDPIFIFSQLSKNIENVCIKLRRYNQAATGAVLVLRTQQFNHTTREITFARPTNLPSEMLRQAGDVFIKMFKKDILYRATGVATFNLVPAVLQPDLFHDTERLEKLQRVYASTDKAAVKYGKHTLFLGTSWQAQQFGAHLTERGDEPERKQQLFLGESKRKRVNIPMLIAKGI